MNLVGLGRPVAEENVAPHGHPPGPHGGTVVAIDRENRFHAEAVFEPGGRVRLYTFARELTEARPVAARTICAAVRGHDAADEYAVMLVAEPQESDPSGAASRFAGRFPPAAWQEHVTLVVWSLPVEGERFRFEICSANTTPDAATVARAEAAEAALYSTPAGKYVAEDVRANGATPASRKYRGVRPTHDHRVRSGERVCPVSGALPDARLTWIVGGKEYRFCCPPCIDEFVTAARERPDEVKEPEFYRQR